MKNLKKLKWLYILINIPLVLIIGLFSYLYHSSLYFNIFLFVVFNAIIIYSYWYFRSTLIQVSKAVDSNINSSLKEALNYSDVGLLFYDDDFVITYQSDLFTKRNLRYVGSKLLSWLPQLHEIISGDSDLLLVELDEKTYEVKKKVNSQVLLFKDVSEFKNLEKRYESERLVLGFLNFDNYDESMDYDEEQSFAINLLKQLVFEYFKHHQVLFKPIRGGRLQLICSYENFLSLKEDHFSILKNFKNQAQGDDLPITLSMGFALGSESYQELDEMASDLLSLAENRGGDQVAIRVVGQEVTYFGGSSEAREKQSKVKVRVIANTLKDLMSKASNVIIVGHLESDADCVGAGVLMSSIAKHYCKEVYYITKSGGVEATIASVLKHYESELSEHNFVTLNEALNHYNSDSLVIMVDHHSKEVSNAAELLEKASKVAIIDHHRRKADLGMNTVMVYIEASASSTVELVCEFIPYILNNYEITDAEANIGYLGVLIDTNHFKMRTGSRTFDVLSLLRSYGADPMLCEEFIQEPFDSLKLKAEIVKNAQVYLEHYAISLNENKVISRSLISQAADEMINTSDVSAAFVISPVNDSEVAISARSNGDVNVQVIMEKMQGGGHLTAAGLQRSNCEPKELLNELVKVLENYSKEAIDESNTIN